MNDISRANASADLLALAQRCRDAGDPWQAVEHCRVVLAAEADNAAALTLLGQCLATTGELNAAGNSLSRAIELDPRRAAAYLHLGEVNAQLGRSPEALRCFQHAVRLAPGDVNALNASALALWGNGRIEEARGLFQRALEIEPENPFTLRNRQLLASRLVDRWHFAMVNDTARNEHFEAALRKVVGPASVVLDIGAGTGLLSMLAARAGARQVIACEANPVLAGTARKIISRNGYSDRIRVLAKPSHQIDPERDFPKNTRPDVLVAEVFDTMLIGEGALATFEHARRYLLAPGAAIIPRRAALYGALVESPRLWREGAVDTACGFDLDALNDFRPETVVLETASFEGRLLADDFPIFEFDFGAGAGAGPSVRLDIPVREAGTCHALVYWIKLQLDDSTSVDNRPLFDGAAPASAYCGHWYQAARLLVPPVAVQPGMSLGVAARHNGRNVAVTVLDPVTGAPL